MDDADSFRIPVEELDNVGSADGCLAARHGTERCVGVGDNEGLEKTSERIVGVFVAGNFVQLSG
jgi:hypothetical protein